MSEPISFTPPEPPELTELLSGYEVNSLVAKGGMGAVYHATQVSLDREVAIKLLPEELCDPEFREQFKAEARAMAKLNHPNLIGIFDYGDARGMPYIVMEYVAGQSLYYSSYGKAIDQSTAVEIVIGICRGLGAAHDSGIIHRDIKPANILLDASARPKIGDFGLASPADGEGDGGTIYGTPGYAAPEIYTDASAIGVPSDLFAVGVILYELLTGEMPDNPPSPPSTSSKCDTRLDPIFKKATRRNPALRYQTAHELADDLDKLLPTLGRGGRRVIKTGLDRAQNRGVVLKRQTASAGPSDPAEPRLVTKKRDESTPSSEQRLNSPASGDEAPPASDSPDPLRVKNPGNKGLIQKLVVLACLIAVIIFSWVFFQEKQEQPQAEQETPEVEKSSEETGQVAGKDQIKKDRLAAAKRAQQNQLEKKQEAAAAKEAAKSPMQQLEELRSQLYEGKRDKFPRGTIDRNTHHLLFIDQAMTWAEASKFAEQHGAHLATPSSQAEIDVLTKRMEAKFSVVWLGGGATATANWGWVNGDPWTYRKPGTTLGSCAALTDVGVIKARPNSEKNPFIIQWLSDGTNPGALSEQLARLVPTLDAPSPAWPPSTVFNENRAFFLVNRDVSWEEADVIARGAEGHLAVVSKAVEGIFIRDYLQSALPPQASAWLGGRLVEGVWTWATGEEWVNVSWSPDSPSGGSSESALRYLNAPDAAGWDDSEPGAGNAQNFLIEWSNDAPLGRHKK